MSAEIDNAADINLKNKETYDEFMKGEEGVDHDYLIPGEKEKMEFNVKKFEREVRQELAACKADPAQRDRADML